MATLDFTSAFKYPFRRWQGMLNTLWVLVPIYGWFLLGGYRVRIVAEFLDGKCKQLPRIRHGSDFTLGWVMFWKAFPALLVLILAGAVLGAFGGRRGPGPLAFLFVLIALLVVPILAMNFIKKRTVASCFEFDLVRVVFKDLGDYCIALLKDFALQLLFIAMWLILVGLPAGLATKNIFIAEFYRTHVKR